MKEEETKGLRYNEDKIRYDLIHPVATEGLAKVLTVGSKKYAPRNWEKGLSWTSVIASLKRHLNAIEQGNDYDSETGLLHIDHVQCNAHFLSTYYRTKPQFDDRQHPYLNKPKIGLDIDEVLADFIGSWKRLWKIEDTPKSWFFDKDINKRFEQLFNARLLEHFYMNLEPLISEHDIPFEPYCYVTSRPVNTHITERWLSKHKFPLAPIFTVPMNTSKADVVKASGCQIFVDDRYENFDELHNAGITTFLYDAPHNQRYDVGHKRIKSLKELCYIQI